MIFDTLGRGPGRHGHPVGRDAQDSGATSSNANLNRLENGRGVTMRYDNVVTAFRSSVVLVPPSTG